MLKLTKPNKVKSDFTKVNAYVGEGCSNGATCTVGNTCNTGDRCITGNGCL